MNTMDIARRHAMMMANDPYGYNLGDVWDATRPRVVGTLPTYPQGHSTRDAIMAAIQAGLQTVNTWLVTRPGANVYVPNQQLPNTQYQGNVPPVGQQLSAGVGQGFNNFAAQFGISPTTLAILGIAGAYLLFRQPPRR